MCLILFSYMNHPDYRLIIAANRDEFYNRPTQPLDFWTDLPDILGGRDGQSLGTWLGINRNGKFAAITNFRAPSMVKAQAPSRGLLVSDYLQGDTGPLDYLETIRKKGLNYNGFNLLAGDSHGLYYYSNMGQHVTSIKSGTYGLSNAFLGTPWPKVEKGKREFAKIVSSGRDIPTEPLFDLLKDSRCPRDEDLPETGVGIEWERLLAPMFINSETYGTRSSALVLVDSFNRVTFMERTYLKKRSGDIDHETRTFQIHTFKE
ncbi:MAG: NRDE family protein [Proteobacteria bacterium]|nr:NRDE family protein [Pseudomonadota bacterium]